MAMNDKHNFAGYIEHQGIQYFCTINDYIVKMFCKGNPPPILGLRINNDESKEEKYIFGFSENNVCFAVLMPQGTCYDEWSYPIHCQFATPIVIKYNDSQLERNDLSYFDAIEFYGETVNKIFDPRQAVSHSKSISKIEDINIAFNPQSDYSKEFDIEINKLNAKIKTLIYRYVHLAEQQNKDGSISLGSLNSAIRIKFNNQQSLETLSRYWLMFNNFLVLLSGRQNVNFGVRLLHKKTPNSPLSHFADGFFRRSSSDIYNGKIQDTIQINALGDKFSALLELFADENPPFLRFLPENNKMANRITDADVLNICTAFEIMYGKDNTENKDKIVNDYEDVELRWKKGNLILAKKMWFLYQKATNTTCTNEFKKIKQEISTFVKLRNAITHTGKLEWGNCGLFSATLIKVLYGNILLSAGIDKDTTIAIVEKKFRV